MAMGLKVGLNVGLAGWRACWAIEPVRMSCRSTGPMAYMGRPSFEASVVFAS